MTCIAGAVGEDHVVIGCDSVCTHGNMRSFFDRKKIFRVGDFIFGCAGSIRAAQVVQYSFKPPEIDDTGIDRYFATDFINALRKTFAECGISEKNNNIESIEVSFLVGFKRNLFVVYGDFQIDRIKDHYAIGSGQQFAMGAMFAKYGELKPVDLVLAGLSAARWLDPFVEEPLYTITTEKE